MKKFIFLLALAWLLASCGGFLLSQVTHPERMTPEQIAAYEKLNKDVYVCFTLGGPPPIGGTTWIVVPKDSKPNLSFGSNCQLIRADTRAVTVP